MTFIDNGSFVKADALDLRWADQWRSALLSVLRTTGSVITGKRLIYRTADLGFAPAASNDDTVMFDSTQLSPELILSARKDGRLNDVVRNNRSLSYHELCHILWTPSVYSDFGRWVQTTGVHSVFNMVEDQRIENLFCKQYSSASSYFKLAVSEHILKGTCSSKDVYLLIAGRLYLPRKQRRAARKIAVEHYGMTIIRLYEELLFQYMGLLFDRDHLAARDILTNIQKLFASEGDPILPQNPCSDSHGRTDGSSSGSSGKQPSKDDKETSSAVKDDLLDELDALGDDNDGDSPSSSGSSSGSGSSDKDADGELEVDGSADSDGSSTDESNEINSSSSGESESTSDPDSSSADGAGTGASSVPSMDTLSEVLEWAQQVSDDAIAETQDDVSSIADAVTSSIDRQRMAERSRWPGTQRAVTSAMRVSSTRIVKEIQQLRTALEPHWERNQLTGKVNLSKLISRNDPSVLNIFNRWHEGSEEDASMELALLLDISSSMAGYEDQLGQMMWVLQDALWQLEIPLTIGVYADSRHTSAVLPTERPNPATYLAPRTQGATNPGPLIERVRAQLQGSPASHRIMLIMTDGHWSTSSYGLSGERHVRGDESVTTADESVAITNAMGIYTGLFGINNAVAMHGSHRCQFASDIDSLDDITDAVRRIIQQLTAQSVM